MKKVSLIAVICVCLSKSVFSQTNCIAATQQLQNYAVKVNEIYFYQYWTYIPNQQCPAIYNGLIVNPTVVQNCRWQMLGYLNQWYSQQCYYVNNAYNQIITSCIDNSNYADPAPAPVIDKDEENKDRENREIDTNQIKNLVAGMDEDKTVKITIPKTVAGFKPN